MNMQAWQIHFCCAHGYLFCCAIDDDLAQVEALEQFVQRLLKIHDLDSAEFVVVVASKCDLQQYRKLQKHHLDGVLQKYNLKYIETSAKMGTNVQSAFDLLVQLVWQKRQKKPLPAKPRSKQQCKTQ